MCSQDLSREAYNNLNGYLLSNKFQAHFHFKDYEEEQHFTIFLKFPKLPFLTKIEQFAEIIL